jgi:hypothetical protein
MAQESASSVESSGSSNYGFLESLPGQRTLQGVGGIGEGEGEPGSEEEEATRVDVFPKETEEERKTRESIRNVLRLLDGDTVQVTKDVHIRLVGVHLPELMTPQERNYFERFSKESEGWLRRFLEDPEKSMKQYDGMNSSISYKDREGSGFTYYYLYVPDLLLEDMRKQELGRYDDWVKKRKGELPKETSRSRADAASAALKEAPLPPSSDEVKKDVNEYVISEAKYYYDDGTLKREEIFRDGKLMIKRLFSAKGELIDEVFYDSRAGALAGLKKTSG